ncbi:hypothetical protein EMCRGX_G026071 [Ephydatia muelleri]|eukprot:Em0021g821a
MAAFLACVVLLGAAGLSSSVAQSSPFLYRLNYADSHEPCVLMQANITLPDTPVLSGLGVNTSMSTVCVRDHTNSINLVLNDTLGHLLQFLFVMTADDYSNTSTYWTLQNVSFTNSVGEYFANNSNLLYCHYNQSFQCNSETDILLLNSTSTPQKSLVLSVVGWQVQAFTFTNQTFDAARHCVKDYKSSVVPVIVGAAMAGLIAVVLVAYVISQIRNWRSQRGSSYGSYGTLR